MAVIEKLENGLVVIVEEIPHLQSAAYELLLGGGVVGDAADTVGASLILAELTSRGAGGLDSRALSQAFEERGIRHAETAEHDRFSYRGSLLAENLDEALRLVALMAREPMLPEDEIESIRSVLLQDLASLVDNPAQRAMVELNKVYFPQPYGRSTYGEEKGLSGTTIARVRELYSERFRPGGSILSVAGNVKAAEVFKTARTHFGGWQGSAPKPPPFGAMPERKRHHIQFESAQLQIVMAYPSAPFGDPHYYAAKVGTGVLSGGMFGRLFIEVREKRGLCYSVHARHSSTQNHGTISIYAGTTPERAHETYEVIVGELQRLKGSVSEEELKRARANLISALVIGEESSGARASSNALDWWLAARVRSLDEIQTGINAVKLAELDRYFDAFPVGPFMSLTLGKREL